MKLAEFISTSGMTDAKFAAAVGLSRSYLTAIKLNKKSPSAEVAMRIERATNGRVRLEDWPSLAPLMRFLKARIDVDGGRKDKADAA